MNSGFENSFSTEKKSALIALLLAGIMMLSSATAINPRNEMSEGLPVEPEAPICDKDMIGAQAGLLHCNNQTQAGFTVFSATESQDTYLIDERGEMRHRWSTTHPDGSAFGIDIGPNGTLLRVVNDYPDGIGMPLMDAGGSATHIEILDANSQLLWEIEEYSGKYRLHHDAVFLPNGNVIAIAWEYFSKEEALAMGRQSDMVTDSGLWPDVVLEYAPAPGGLAQLVWSWRPTDHLVQNFNSTLPHYGVVSDHPQKLDINAVSSNIQKNDADWMHCNSIDHDPVRDHILLSCRHTEELYIIDHNLSWEQSNSSMGDFLYRWGNPVNYDVGTLYDQHTVLQHDARFVPPGDQYAGSITYFSNELSGPSVIGMIHPPRVGNRFALNASIGMYDPVRPDVEFTLPSGWGPRFQSGSILLPNGQFQVSHALRGKIGQIGTDGTIDWEYNIPLNAGGDIADRLNRPFPSVFFKAEWLEQNDPRLQFLPMLRQGVIEQYEDACSDNSDDILWDKNGDGCIEDDDGDGVLNDMDWCANTPFETVVDQRGCTEVEILQPGCTDPEAINFDPEATDDDGSCAYPPPELEGCTNESAMNYDPEATVHNETMCDYPEPPEPEPVLGCTDGDALNYNVNSTLDDGSCVYPEEVPPTVGCHDPTAENYNLSTDLHDANVCTYPPPAPPEVAGCTDTTALNFNPNATLDDESCIFSPPSTNNETTVDDTPVTPS